MEKNRPVSMPEKSKKGASLEVKYKVEDLPYAAAHKAKVREIEDRIKQIEAEQVALTEDRNLKEKEHAGVFRHYGGQKLYESQMQDLSGEIESLKSDLAAVKDLYSTLGGDAIDEAEARLLKATRGKTRATWSVEARLIEEHSLKPAQAKFEENSAKYEAEGGSGAPTTPPVETKPSLVKSEDEPGEEEPGKKSAPVNPEEDEPGEEEPGKKSAPVNPEEDEPGEEEPGKKSAPVNPEEDEPGKEHKKISETWEQLVGKIKDAYFNIDVLCSISTDKMTKNNVEDLQYSAHVVKYLKAELYKLLIDGVPREEYDKFTDNYIVVDLAANGHIARARAAIEAYDETKTKPKPAAELSKEQIMAKVKDLDLLKDEYDRALNSGDINKANEVLEHIVSTGNTIRKAFILLDAAGQNEVIKGCENAGLKARLEDLMDRKAEKLEKKDLPKSGNDAILEVFGSERPEKKSKVKKILGALAVFGLTAAAFFGGMAVDGTAAAKDNTPTASATETPGDDATKKPTGSRTSQGPEVQDMGMAGVLNERQQTAATAKELGISVDAYRQFIKEHGISQDVKPFTAAAIDQTRDNDNNNLESEWAVAEGICGVMNSREGATAQECYDQLHAMSAHNYQVLAQLVASQEGWSITDDGYEGYVNKLANTYKENPDVWKKAYKGFFIDPGYTAYLSDKPSTGARATHFRNEDGDLDTEVVVDRDGTFLYIVDEEGNVKAILRADCDQVTDIYDAILAPPLPLGYVIGEGATQVTIPYSPNPPAPNVPEEPAQPENPNPPAPNVPEEPAQPENPNPPAPNVPEEPAQPENPNPPAPNVPEEPAQPEPENPGEKISGDPDKKPNLGINTNPELDGQVQTGGATMEVNTDAGESADRQPTGGDGEGGSAATTTDQQPNPQPGTAPIEQGGADNHSTSTDEGEVTGTTNDGQVVDGDSSSDSSDPTKPQQ